MQPPDLSEARARLRTLAQQRVVCPTCHVLLQPELMGVLHGGDIRCWRCLDATPGGGILDGRLVFLRPLTPRMRDTLHRLRSPELDFNALSRPELRAVAALVRRGLVGTGPDGLPRPTAAGRKVNAGIDAELARR